ncbi:MAG: nickel pincer cofactor biosynthesis protein LarB [Deltaproteobacteria bacterium]|nr:nickel pincer cofactor biosynthesis protein LarB [Deltaproteobacteria bacterium]
MDRRLLEELLERFRRGETTLEEVREELARMPFHGMGDVVVDTHRGLRLGFPEVVFGLGKTAEQVVRIAAALTERGSNVLVTKLQADKVVGLRERFGPDAVEHDEVAGAVLVRHHPVEVTGRGTVCIVAAGTSDLPVAREASFTARCLGNRVEEVFDVGVAGVHRLLHHLPGLRSANVLVVVAGMEGALPSVVGGLVSRPIIAVPTSVGYGASFGGIAALLGMLNSCAPGVTVVNIDNGFGAAYAASLINREFGS